MYPRKRSVSPFYRFHLISGHIVHGISRHVLRFRLYRFMILPIHPRMAIRSAIEVLESERKETASDVIYHRLKMLPLTIPAAPVSREIDVVSPFLITGTNPS